MTEDGKIKTNSILVSGPLYVKSLTALQELINALVNNYKFIQNSGYNEETKEVSLILLGDSIHALNLVTDALEASIADNTAPPNASLLN